MGFIEFRRDYPVHFASGKTTAKMIFEGADCKEDEPRSETRFKGSKRKLTRRNRARLRPSAKLKTRSET